MRECPGDLWDFHDRGVWVAITTNGVVRADGHAVMGRGVALEAAQRFSYLPAALGNRLTQRGNHVFAFPTIRLLTLPVKERWSQPALTSLIEDSLRELVAAATALNLSEVALVRPGCGNGGLSWSHVRQIVAPILDDRFVVVEKASLTCGRGNLICGTLVNPNAGVREK